MTLGELTDLPGIKGSGYDRGARTCAYESDKGKYTASKKAL
jgi:hypothetical protein